MHFFTSYRPLIFAILCNILAKLIKDSQLLMALLEEDKKRAKLLLADGANPNGKLVSIDYILPQ